jgi:CBS domain-containing protein
MSLAMFRKPAIVAEENESVRAIAQMLRDHHVGCVVITRDTRPVGIITDRDIAIRVVAEGLDPKTKAAEIVTYDPVVVTEDESIESAAAKIRKHGVRRLPIVTANGAIAGVVTADDLVMLLGRELADIGEGLASSSDTEDSR